jgi:glycerol kinase
VAGELLLALDLGTTHARALLVDAEGQVRGRALRRLAVHFPAPGRVEQDPEEFAAAAEALLPAALSEAGAVAADVAAIGIATQRATALAWDAETGAPLAPALSWQDQRPREIADWLRARGAPFSSQAAASRFAWWLEREPAVRRAAQQGRLRLGTPDAWLERRLGGEALSDPGQAMCTGLYDPGRGDWSEVLVERYGLERAWLPRIVPTSGLRSETRTALLGAPVALGARAGDQQAAAFAQGVHDPGKAKLTLGTAAMLDVHTGGAPTAPPPGAIPMPLWRLDDGTEAWCLEAHAVTAGAAVEWLVALGVLEGAEDLDALAASVPDAGGVVVIPAFQGLGTPFLDEAARGFVGGLTRGSTRAHLARALVEGLAQRFADLCEALPLKDGPLPVDGGLSRSDLLLQCLADLSGRTVERAAESETTALGAAWLAGLAAGCLESPEACQTLRAPPRRFEPGLAEDRRRAARQRWGRILERARSEPVDATAASA